MEMCALDLCRRINEFGKLRQKILFWILGRYAANELIMLRWNLHRKWDTTFEYGCEDCNYNKETSDWDIDPFI